MEFNLQTITEIQPEGPKSSTWQLWQQKAIEMRERYGNAEQFLTVFSPDLQPVTAQHAERAYLGTAPCLSVVAAGYGEPVVEVWICIQLENINLFAGVKEKMPVSRQKEVAGLIRTEYPFLKVSEVLLFFYRLKCGRYGRFYGSVDALFITTSLVTFMEERRRETTAFLSARQKTESATRPSSGGISYEEYLIIKQQKQKDHEHE